MSLMYQREIVKTNSLLPIVNLPACQWKAAAQTRSLSLSSPRWTIGHLDTGRCLPQNIVLAES